MPSIEETFETAVGDKVIPGAILVASSTDNSYKFAKSFGYHSLKEDQDKKAPLELDAVLWLGSCTKILTAISALQCVERGHFSLDEDVTRLLPELKDIDVQPKPKDGSEPLPPVKAKNVITLRRLLTHTSGLSYTRFGELKLPLIERCLAPLQFEPGQGFIYGTGTDFAGIMVERVSGQSLEAYIQENVGAPLGITSICFRPASDPAIARRVPDVSTRKVRPGPVEYLPSSIWPPNMPDDSGGSGGYCTLVDFQKILHSLTANDGVLLSGAMVDELWTPDTSPVVRAGVKAVLQNEDTNNIYGGMPKGADVSYAPGGMIMLQDLPGRRPKGALYWGGLLNVFFWMDRENGLSGIYGSQVFPAGDPQCLALFAEFERKTYELVREKKRSLA